MKDVAQGFKNILTSRALLVTLGGMGVIVALVLALS
jgi:hypothetical protein